MARLLPSSGQFGPAQGEHEITDLSGYLPACQIDDRLTKDEQLVALHRLANIVPQLAAQVASAEVC